MTGFGSQLAERSAWGSRVARRRQAAALLACLVAAAGPAKAELRTKYFSMDRPDIVSTTSYEFEDEKRTTRFRETDETTKTWTQEIEISTEGWVYHPALAIYSVSLRPEYEIENTKASGGFSRSDKILFFGYTFDTTILQFKPYTFKLFSSRDRSQFDSTLSRNTVTETATDRATAILKYEPFPTTITAEHNSSETTGFFDTKQDTISVRTDSRHITDNSRTFVDSEYRSEEREIRDTKTEVDRFLLNLVNTYDYSVDTRIFSRWRGDITSLPGNNIKNLNGSESMTVDHEENLRGQYELGLDMRRQTGSFSNTYQGSASLSHQLYDNLTTTVGTNLSRGDFSTGRRHAGSASLDFDYRRSIPRGNVNLTNGYSYRLEDNDVEPVTTTVLDESLALSGTSVVLLANLNIDTGSIVVTNLGGVPFIEIVDYIVVDIGGDIGVARTLLGGIADPETVLVDYRFTPTGPNRLSEFEMHAGASVSLWNALTLSYNFNRSRETLISGIPPATLADETRHRVAGSLRWRFSTTFADYEVRESSRTPQKRWSVRENLFFRPLDRLSVVASLGYSEFTFETTNETTKTTNGRIGLRWSPVRWGTLSIDAVSRRIRGDVQRSDDRGIDAAFRWRYGLWSGRLTYENLRQSDFRSGQKRRRQVFLVQLTRQLWR